MSASHVEFDILIWERMGTGATSAAFAVILVDRLIGTSSELGGEYVTIVSKKGRRFQCSTDTAMAL